MGSDVRPGPVFRFGTFEADAGRSTLFRNGTPVRIQDQPFRVLIHLLEHAGTLVTREQLRQLLWGDETFVDFDASLNVILKKLRGALRDDSENPRFIETVPRHGYRFIAPVAIVEPGPDTARGVEAPRSARIGRRWWVGAVQLAAVAALAAFATFLVMNRERARPDSAAVVRSQVLPPPNANFASTNLALSDDGRMLAFVASASTAGAAALWVEAMNSGSTHRLTGTEGATLPFWSPDGQNIGFFAHGRLWRVGSEGGPPQPLCDAPLGRGGTWNHEGVIVFAPDLDSPLEKISASGGAPAPAGPSGSWWPQFLPDGQHFISWSHSDKGSDVDGIYLSALNTTERTLLIATESNGLYANGHLLYVHDQHLLARSFDPVRRRLGTASDTLADGIGIHGGMHFADFTASQNGLLAYFAGTANRGWPMAIYDRAGTRQRPIVPQRDIYLNPRFSPDGRRLAVSIVRPDSSLADLWVADVEAGTRTRITFDEGDPAYPIWSADGKTIYYSSNGTDRVPHIYQRLSNGAGQGTPLLTTAGVSEVPMDVSGDGRYLAYARRESGKHSEIWILPLAGSGSPHAFAQLSQADVTDPAFAPDGTRMAYTTNETGGAEVYISPFGRGAGKWQVSFGGGRDPVWAPDGNRLYFIDDAENVMSVDVRDAGGAISVSRPAMFAQDATFQMPRPLAVAPDGRVLVDGHRDAAISPSAITLVINWPIGLKRSER